MILTEISYHSSEERMVKRKMKNILLYADKNITEAVNKNISNDYNVICANRLQDSDINSDTHFIIADVDTPDLNAGMLINKYKKFKTKFWAYAKITSRENILKLYEMGFDNVVPYPTDINNLLSNIINPDNTDINIKDAITYKNLKKILLVVDDKINAELIVNALSDSNFLFTIRTNAKDANIEIQKDQYNLVIIDCKTPTDDLFNISKTITESKLNKNTPYILISASKKIKNHLKGYEYGAYSYIKKPYNIDVLKAMIKNILEIKALQDNLATENKILDCLITNTINQSIITDSNFVVLAGGNQYIPFNKNEYFFNYFDSYNIIIPVEKIRAFSINTEKSIKFNFTNENKIFETTITKVYDEHNILERYVIILSDITQKLMIEDQKETFIATLTHDLKSPIRAEETVLKMLLDEKFGSLNKEQKEILSEILNSRAYTKRMVDNLLTRYKATSDKIEIMPEQTSYKKIIFDAVKEIEPLIIEKQQKIKVEYKADTDNFEFAPTEIKRVLVNLLSNASEYTPKHGEIFLKVLEINKKIITSLTDTGYGIEEKDLCHIFDRNVTLAKKYRKVGTGLGLYISKTLINAHGGDITVQSKIGKGTTFTFKLPKNQNQHLTTAKQ